MTYEPSNLIQSYVDDASFADPVVRPPMGPISPLMANVPETTDAAATSSTIYSLGDNDVFQGTLTDGSDDDWIAVTLADGAFLTVQMVDGNGDLNGVQQVMIVGSTGSTIGNELFYNSNTSTAQYYNNTGASQTVYVFAGSFLDSSVDPNADYEITALVQNYETATSAEIAEYLVNGWVGTGRAWDVDVSDGVTTNDTIYYDITTISTDAQALAVAAFEAWTFATGIQFVASDFAVSGLQGITFDDDNFDADFDGDIDADDRSAAAGPDGTSDGVIITDATVTITDNWLDYYGTGLTDYSFLTYIHEIGHALGLDHTGPYNGVATYSSVPGGDNVFVNDSWGETVMSYFSLDEVNGNPLSFFYPVSIMSADIIAAQTLYGVAGNLRTGDTTYGFNSNVGGYWDVLTALTGAFGLTIIDDGGIDTIDFSGLTVTTVLDLEDGSSSNVAGGVENMYIHDGTIIENAILGSGDDTVYGNSGNNEIFGGDGADRIDSVAGQNTLFGGVGADLIYGGDTLDTIYGGNGDDYLTLWFAQGTVEGGRGNDSLFGGAGGDLLFGGNDLDVVYGDSGADHIEGGSGADTAYGGNGLDTIYGNAGADSIQGGNDADTIYGGAQNDWIFGGDGVDSLNGGYGNDSIYGGAGADTIEGGVGVDWIEGGIGADVITSAGGNDTVFGGAENDEIFGSLGNDLLQGDSGADTLYGGSSLDSIYGGVGEDSINGGFGRDLIYGDADNDSINGASSDDTIYGGAGLDTILGSDGADYIDGGTENDSISGNAGRDTIYGGSGDDRINGGTSDDIISGDAGNDTLFGSISNDFLYGGADDDVLYGGAGQDILVGGSGNDTLRGQAGQDVFEFYNGDETVTVWDFEDNTDQIALAENLWGGGLTATQALNTYGTEVGGNVVLDFGSGNILTIRNTTITELYDDTYLIFLT